MSDYLNIRWLGSEKSKVGKFVPGGSVWHVSGEAVEEEGVLLLPNPTRIYDTPMRTFWEQGNYGRVFQGFGIDNRDPLLGFQIYAGVNGLPEDWRYTDSMFRRSWSYEKPGRLVFETSDTLRFLELQKLSEPESYQGSIEDGRDPFLFGDATIIMKAAGENPNYQTEPIVEEKTCTSTSGFFTFTVINDGDFECWPKWTVSSIGSNVVWKFSDYSLGSDEYRQEGQHANRMWTAPKLTADEHTTFDADPRNEFASSSKDTNVWARCVSQLLYPIPPHTRVTLRAEYTGAVVGDSVRLTYAPQHTLPFSTPYFEDWVG